DLAACRVDHARELAPAVLERDRVVVRVADRAEDGALAGDDRRELAREARVEAVHGKRAAAERAQREPLLPMERALARRDLLEVPLAPVLGVKRDDVLAALDPLLERARPPAASERRAILRALRRVRAPPYERERARQAEIDLVVDDRAARDIDGLALSAALA